MNAVVKLSEQSAAWLPAIRYQDDAYTLAFYLSGDDQDALQAVEAAFGHLRPARSTLPGAVRLDLLREVVAQCRKLQAVSRRPADPLVAGLQRLGDDARAAVVLVDVLGLSYQDAARVTRATTRQIARRLGAGRLGLALAEAGQSVHHLTA